MMEIIDESRLLPTFELSLKIILGKSPPQVCSNCSLPSSLCPEHSKDYSICKEGHLYAKYAPMGCTKCIAKSMSPYWKTPSPLFKDIYKKYASSKTDLTS